MFLEVDEGFYAHRKTLRFCALMQNTEAWSHIQRLWAWACRSAPAGDLAGMEPAEVEIAMGWPALDGRAYAAAVKAGFLDEAAPGKPGAIHGWMDRTGKSIAKMAAEAQKKRDYRAGKPWDVLRLEILERDKHACKDCGARPEDLTALHVHHVIPLRKFENKAAGNSPANLVSLCEECHNKRDAAIRRADRNTTAVAVPPPSVVTAVGTADTVQNSPEQTRTEQAPPAGARDPWRSGYEWRHAFGLSWAKKYRTQSYGNGGDGKAMGTLTDDVLAGMNDSELVPLWAEREKFFAAFLACADEKLVKAKHPFAFFVARFSDFRPDLRRRAAVAALPVIATAEKTSPEARGWSPKEKRLDVRVPGDGGELERIEPGKEAAS